MRKQTFHHHIKHLLLGLSLCLCSHIVKAQDTQAPGKTSDSTAINQLAVRLSVSNEKAIEIHRAFNARHDRIDQLAKDTLMNAKQKQLQLSSLLAQRKQMISSALNSTEKEQLKQISATGEQSRQQTIKQRHQQQLARIQHQQMPTVPIEVLKPGKLPSEKQP